MGLAGQAARCCPPPISIPLSLTVPIVPYLLAVAVVTMQLTFPRSVMAHFTKTVESTLSLVSKLAYQWPLQSPSVPISVMRCSYTRLAGQADTCCPAHLLACLLDLVSQAPCHPAYAPACVFDFSRSQSLPCPSCFPYSAVLVRGPPAEASAQKQQTRIWVSAFDQLTQELWGGAQQSVSCLPAR